MIILGLKVLMDLMSRVLIFFIFMIVTEGYSHEITSSTVFSTLGFGWAAFSLSLIFNILYYALHPSEVTEIAVQ